MERVCRCDCWDLNNIHMSSKRQTNLYHCTKCDSLLKILASKYFRYSYCLEEYFLHKGDGFSLEKLAYAIICFADLYSDELEDHMHRFNADSYIMMEKTWAKGKKICPVIYYDRDSWSHWAFLAMILYTYDLDKDIASVIEINHQVDEEGARLIERVHKLYKSIEIFRPFLKKYEGQYYIKDKGSFSDETTEFFLEREWRSIPIVTGGERYFLDFDDYLNEEIRNKASQELLDHNYCIRFDWGDIKQIGCKEGEKSVIIHAIRESFGVDEDEAENKIIIIHK